MCGIAGIWGADSGEAALNANQDTLKRMAGALAHRGPDDEGFWHAENGLMMAHRRLSIQDLSGAGHQPMSSHCGRYLIVYNGEVYNFLEIGDRLRQQGYRFKGHSDTEIVLESIVEWGLEEALRMFNGMFALALWDRHEQTLVLARDRAGKKPLYFGWAGEDFIFGSELKALTEHPAFAKDIDQRALAHYLQKNFVPAPYSIYQRAWKLLPGSFLTLRIDEIRARSASLYECARYYWDPVNAALHSFEQPFEGSLQEACTQLNDLLAESTRKRMIADVPLGMLLSGGIDSTLVTAVAQANSAAPLNTFSIGFSGEAISEAAAAKQIARHLGTNHTELYLDGQSALDIIPLLPSINDEPFGDPSQIPTYLVSKLARQHVTVALSGDGGDELFFGYKRYISGLRLWRLNRRIPRFIRAGLGNLLAGMENSAAFESKKSAHAACLLAENMLDLYHARLNKFIAPERLLAESPRQERSRTRNLKQYELAPAQAMMLQDFISYLVDGVLVKVDRASMKESLEIRNPLLDPSVIDFAWRLPMEYKFGEGRSKLVLRKLLNQYVPEQLTDRPKQGFGSPVDSWLQGPLKAWADDLLSVSQLQSDGIFNPQVVNGMWEECKSNPGKGHSRIWTLLMFQVWHQGNVKA